MAWPLNPRRPPSFSPSAVSYPSPLSSYLSPSSSPLLLLAAVRDGAVWEGRVRVHARGQGSRCTRSGGGGGGLDLEEGASGTGKRLLGLSE
jgi:hypothetical protein